MRPTILLGSAAACFSLVTAIDMAMITNFPVCATSCLGQSLARSTCDDVACKCKDTAENKLTQECIAQSCNEADQKKVKETKARICASSPSPATNTTKLDYGKPSATTSDASNSTSTSPGPGSTATATSTFGSSANETLSNATSSTPSSAPPPESGSGRISVTVSVVILGFGFAAAFFAF